MCILKAMFIQGFQALLFLSIHTGNPSIFIGINTLSAHAFGCLILSFYNDIVPSEHVEPFSLIQC